MSENKKSVNPPSELNDEALDKVSGGNGQPVILGPEWDDYFAGLPNLLPKKKGNGTAEKTEDENAPGSGT